MNQVNFLIGSVRIKTELDIITLGNIISKEMLCGIQLGGLERKIYNEIPAIYIQTGSLLGLDVTLQGWWELSEKDIYILEISTLHTVDNESRNAALLNNYLKSYCKQNLKDYLEIEILN